MSARLQEFNQHCEKINAAIRKIPDPKVQRELRMLIEELTLGLSSARWIGCRVAWVPEIPDSPEGIENL